MKKTTFLLITLISIHTYCFGNEMVTLETKYISPVNEVEYTLELIMPSAIDSNKSLRLVIYPDAQLNFGENIKNIVTGSEFDGFDKNLFLIGIKHGKNYKTQRWRDLIPPSQYYKQKKGYGEADQFYRMIVDHLLPKIESDYQFKFSSKTLMGHSFGGLFATYALLQTDCPFDHIFAYSPSLWAQHRQIVQIDYTDSIKQRSITSRYYVAYGSLEVMNKIKRNVNTFTGKSQFDNQSKIKVKKTSISGKFHNNYLRKSLIYDLSYLNNFKGPSKLE